MLNIITSGRLGQAFEHFASTIEGIKCSYVDASILSEVDISKFDVYAGFGAGLESVDISNLSWIHSFGAGIDFFMNHPKLKTKTLISRTKGSLGSKIAEYCLTYLLFSLKKVNQLGINQSSKSWNQVNTKNLKDQNVLIYGTGNIGSSIAKALYPLVNSLEGVSLSGKHKPNFHNVYKYSGQLTEPGKFNIIINTLPLTQETLHFFNAQLFSSFEGAIFINVGRGKSVVVDDLESAISDGNIKLAILDVFPIEPLPESSSLWQNKKIIITPHISGVTSIEDVKSSFKLAFKYFSEDRQNPIFTSLYKGY